MDTTVPKERQAEKTILIVEDDESIGDFLSLAIAQETPYQVVLVNDGPHALQAAQSFHPALLITDYWLPGLNGLELFERMRSCQELEELSALLISANLPKRELKQQGVIGIEKPFDLDMLLQTIARLLSSPQSERK